MAGSGPAAFANSGCIAPRTCTAAAPASGSAAMPYSSAATASLTLQPQKSGGEFVGPYPWKQRLHQANLDHFRNHSFRGDQERVGSLKQMHFTAQVPPCNRPC